MRYSIPAALAVILFAISAIAGPINLLFISGGGGSNTPVPPVGDGAFTDDFDRPNDPTGISNGAPDPPGSYIERTSDATNCNTDLYASAIRFTAANLGCDVDFWYAIADYDIGTPDHSVMVRIRDISNWPSQRGLRIVLRDQGDETGNHYELRLAGGSSPLIRLETTDYAGVLVANQWPSGGANGGDCDMGRRVNPDDVLAATVEGIGADTIVKVWLFNSAEYAARDPHDPNTWGDPKCSKGLDNPVNAVDTGNFAGVGITIANSTLASHTYFVDDLTVSDQIVTPVPPGPDRTLLDMTGDTNGVYALGTTSATMTVTTDVNATCQWNFGGGLAYDDPGMTAYSTTGGTSHSTSVSPLNDGLSYTACTRCSDGTDPNPDDECISFSVDPPLEVTGLILLPDDMKITASWSASSNLLTHDHWNLRYRASASPDWIDEGQVTPPWPIYGLSNDTQYTIEVESCDSGDSSCSEWVSGTATPVVSSGFVDVETACDAGTSPFCCYEPLNGPETAVGGAPGPGHDFASSGNTTECWGRPSPYLAFDTNGAQTVVATSDFGSAEHALRQTNGFMWFYGPSPASIITPSHKSLCYRYYKKVPALYASAGSNGGSCPTSDQRNKLFQSDMGGHQVQVEETNAGDCPPLGEFSPLQISIDNPPVEGNYSFTPSVDLGDCVASACRMEFCVDRDLSAGTNIVYRSRITPIGTGVEHVAESPMSNPGSASNAFWFGGDIFHTGPGEADLSHFTFSIYQTNGVWPGKSCEVEGGC